MELLCHRCGATLVPAETFCPNCGAPQLRIEQGIEGVEAFNAASPRQPGIEARDPSWKDAILAAVIFAVPVGLLDSNLVPYPPGGFFFWVVAGAIGAVNFYRRRAGTSLLNFRVGLRIGMLLGLLAGVLSATADGLLMVAQRYVFHNTATPDKDVQTLIEAFMQADAQNPQTKAQMQDFLAALPTPNGRAALVLFATFISSLGILAFSVIGGALGAKLFSARKVGMRNS
ncbi:MAG TPA: zinc-ribbon domain-containing protein [Acidisarcina sp.]